MSLINICVDGEPIALQHVAAFQPTLETGVAFGYQMVVDRSILKAIPGVDDGDLAENFLCLAKDLGDSFILGLILAAARSILQVPAARPNLLLASVDKAELRSDGLTVWGSAHKAPLASNGPRPETGR